MPIASHNAIHTILRAFALSTSGYPSWSDDRIRLTRSRSHSPAQNQQQCVPGDAPAGEKRQHAVRLLVVAAVAIWQHLFHIRFGDVGVGAPVDARNGRQIFGALGQAAASRQPARRFNHVTASGSANKNQARTNKHKYKISTAHASGVHSWTPPVPTAKTHQLKMCVGVDGFRIKCTRLQELPQ